ncbi:hypothetical protein OH77DRAFT_764630 [Trametes cingulata]|nr:hypothetical protein OH77DRAFT_764630 [Trametes cingulata]
MPADRSKEPESSAHWCDVCETNICRDFGRHYKSHGRPTIKCPYAGCTHKGFNQKVNLEAHIDRDHLAIRRHVCPHFWVDEYGQVTQCAAKFYEKGILIRHRQRCHGYQTNTKNQVFEVRFKDSAAQRKDRHLYEEVLPRTDVKRAAARGGLQAATPALPVAHPTPNSSTSSSTPLPRLQQIASVYPTTPRSTAAPQTPSVASKSSGHQYRPTSNFAEMLGASSAFLAPQALQTLFPDFPRYNAQAAQASQQRVPQTTSFSPYANDPLALGMGASMNGGFANTLASDMPPLMDPLSGLSGPFYITAPYPSSSSSARPTYPVTRNVQDNFAYSYPGL